MNEGRLAAGETLSTPTGFLVAGAANPLVDTLERLEQKLDAGVNCFQTNIVYDVDRFQAWFAPLHEAGFSEPGAGARRSDAAAKHQDAPPHARQRARASRSTKRRSRGWTGWKAIRPRQRASRSRSTSSGACVTCRAWRACT